MASRKSNSSTAYKLRTRRRKCLRVCRRAERLPLCDHAENHLRRYRIRILELTGRRCTPIAWPSVLSSQGRSLYTVLRHEILVESLRVPARNPPTPSSAPKTTCRSSSAHTPDRSSTPSSTHTAGNTAAPGSAPPASAAACPPE